jgi:glycosyltransferase 2 family protein
MIALGAGLAAIAAVGDFPEIDWHFRPVEAILATLASACFLIANAEIWRRLLRALGPELKPLRGLAIWFASGLGRYVPTSLLLPMLRVAMPEREGAPKRISLAALVYEFSLFFSASLIVAAYFVITLPQLAGAWQRFLVLVVPAVALVAMHPRIFHTSADRGLARLGRTPLPASLPERRIVEFTGLYVANLILAGLGVFWMAQLIYPVGANDLPTIIGSFSVATTVSLLAFVTPGGLGAREAGMAVALSPVMPAAPAIAISLLSRLLQLGIEVLLTVVTLFFVRREESARQAEPETITGR